MITTTRYIIIFSTFLLISATWSCGTRKVQKSHEEVVTTVRDTAATTVNAAAETSKVTEQETHVEENINWDEATGTITPADPARPMTITDHEGKKTVFENAAVQFGKKSGISHTTAHDKITVTEQSKDTTTVNKISGKYTEIVSVKDNKEGERKGVATSITFWIGIAAGLCLITWFLWLVIFKRKKENTL